uniref:Uncharacterized protein n=1 Tax=Rhizophora mucronata TaxID=61149 RepID=A0A2P2Q0J8_RHIMU
MRIERFCSLSPTLGDKRHEIFLYHSIFDGNHFLWDD